MACVEQYLPIFLNSGHIGRNQLIYVSNGPLNCIIQISAISNRNAFAH